MKNWSIKDIPDLTGKSAIVTGATGGLGYETALELAGAGADVIVAARNLTKGKVTLENIRQKYPHSKIRFELLDLASLKSVHDFAQRMDTQLSKLDILVNNAGVMSLPQRHVTEDGFELQTGVNYLSHFLLTTDLMPLLMKAAQSRVINVSSILARRGTIQFDDLLFENHYSPNPPYWQSKLAMLMFSLELQRRSNLGGWGVTSIAAHPGYARTDLIANGPGTKILSRRIGEIIKPFISQSATQGALPQLYAATSPDAQPAGYYGPDGFWEMKGRVSNALIIDKARNPADLARLWDNSVELTGAQWPTNA